MIKILFICHGNICRSPMAEFVFKDMVKKAGLSKHFEIASAATSNEECWGSVGNPVYPPARRVMEQHGLNCSGKRARQMNRSDYQKWDMLIGMDSANIRNMHRICGGDPEGKISKMLEYAGRHGDVADPWYTGNFDATWRDVNDGCKGLLTFIQENYGIY